MDDRRRSWMPPGCTGSVLRLSASGPEATEAQSFRPPLWDGAADRQATGPADRGRDRAGAFAVIGRASHRLAQDVQPLAACGPDPGPAGPHDRLAHAGESLWGS